MAKINQLKEISSADELVNNSLLPISKGSNALFSVPLNIFIVNSLDSDKSNLPLSAAKGKELKQLVDKSIKSDSFSSLETIGARYNLDDVKTLLNDILNILKGASAMIMFLLLIPLFALTANADEYISVDTARFDKVYNDDKIVTNVTVSPALVDKLSTIPDSASTNNMVVTSNELSEAISKIDVKPTKLYSSDNSYLHNATGELFRITSVDSSWTWNSSSSVYHLNYDGTAGTIGESNFRYKWKANWSGSSTVTISYYPDSGKLSILISGFTPKDDIYQPKDQNPTLSECVLTNISFSTQGAYIYGGTYSFIPYQEGTPEDTPYDKFSTTGEVAKVISSIPTPDYSTNNTELVNTITNLASKLDTKPTRIYNSAGTDALDDKGQLFDSTIEIGGHWEIDQTKNGKTSHYVLYYTGGNDNLYWVGDGTQLYYMPYNGNFRFDGNDLIPSVQTYLNPALQSDSDAIAGTYSYTYSNNKVTAIYVPMSNQIQTNPYTHFALESVPDRTIISNYVYSVGDLLGDNGKAYRCTNSYTSSASPTSPSSDAAHWVEIPTLNSLPKEGISESKVSMLSNISVDKLNLYGTDNLMHNSNITSSDYSEGTYGNGIYIACKSSGMGGGIKYSFNGEYWIDSNITSGNYKLCYCNGIFYACGTGIKYSYDGKVWIQSNKTTDSFNNVIYDGNKYLASCYSVGIFESSDGITWSDSPITISGLSSNNQLYKLAYFNGTYITSCNGMGLYWSTNLVTWYRSNITSYGYENILVGNNKFISSGGTGIKYSYDGKTWIDTNITGSGNRSHILYSNGLYFCDGARQLLYSIDGITWNDTKLFSGYNYIIAFGNSRLCIGSSSGIGIKYLDTISFINSLNYKTILSSESMPVIPTQEELTEAVKKIFTALGGTINE